MNEIWNPGPETPLDHERKSKGKGFRRPNKTDKPKEICFESPVFSKKDDTEFILEQCTFIENNISNLGLELGFLKQNEKHVGAVLAFLYRHYPPDQATEICAFDLYRFSQFGHGILLWDGDEVIGTIFEESYNNAEKTSFTMRLAVDKRYQGYKLSKFLMRYSCLAAMAKGSTVKRGLIEAHNIHSLYLNLNHVGWLCDGFQEKIPGLGTFLNIKLKLDPTSLMENRVDHQKLLHFIKIRRPGTDYMLIPSSDIQGMKDLFEEGGFHIVAVLQGSRGQLPQLVAVPISA